MSQPTPAQQFAAYPAAQAVATDVGHGYGTARRYSRCPFTGAEIQMGESIRRMTLTTRDGRQRTGYTANRIFGALQFAGDWPCWSRWTLPGSGWADHRDDVLARLDRLQSISIMGPDLQVQTYSWEPLRGVWLGKRFATLSTKQVAASLRRRKRVAAYRTTDRQPVAQDDTPDTTPAPQARTHHPAQLKALLLCGWSPLDALRATGASVNECNRLLQDDLVRQVRASL
jgi:hypothetical protein